MNRPWPQLLLCAIALGVLSMTACIFLAPHRFQRDLGPILFIAVAATLLAFACLGGVGDRRRDVFIGWGGAVSSLAGFASFIAFITVERHLPFNKDQWVLGVCVLIMSSMASAHYALTGRAVLASAYSWCRPAARGAALVLLAVSIAAIHLNASSKPTLLAIGVVAISLCGLTFALAAFHLLSAIPARSLDQQRSVHFCPRCAATLNRRPGAIACKACNSDFRIAFSDPAKRLPVTVIHRS
jgi:hypothetical protein